MIIYNPRRGIASKQRSQYKEPFSYVLPPPKSQENKSFRNATMLMALSNPFIIPLLSSGRSSRGEVPIWSRSETLAEYSQRIDEHSSVKGDGTAKLFTHEWNMPKPARAVSRQTRLPCHGFILSFSSSLPQVRSIVEKKIKIKNKCFLFVLCQGTTYKNVQRPA
ncbi:hypothetical protein BGZ63DRAFT_113379 [Mariannaea sp. PMI_226]|nr:hypothetical protein BGZ63DRAFT_113379 [Mariannaea sp. PMI_226]